MSSVSHLKKKILSPDLSFVFALAFAWKVAVIVTISAVPEYIIKLIHVRVAPAASQRLPSVYSQILNNLVCAPTSLPEVPVVRRLQRQNRGLRRHRPGTRYLLGTNDSLSKNFCQMSLIDHSCRFRSSFKVILLYSGFAIKRGVVYEEHSAFYCSLNL